jgi:hypothetical protein
MFRIRQDHHSTSVKDDVAMLTLTNPQGYHEPTTKWKIFVCMLTLSTKHHLSYRATNV